MVAPWVAVSELATPTNPHAAEFAQAATDILWELSGRRYSGVRTVTETYKQLAPQELDSGLPTPVLDRGTVRNVYSSCETCGCSHLVKLRGQPVREIEAVRFNDTRIPLRTGAVDVVLMADIWPDDTSLPAIAEGLRVIRPGGRLIVIGYYGRDDVAPLLEPETVALAIEATQRRSVWWLRNGFKIKVVHARVDVSDADLAHELLPRLYGDRGRAWLMGPHGSSLRLNLGLFHRGPEAS